MFALPYNLPPQPEISDAHTQQITADALADLYGPISFNGNTMPGLEIGNHIEIAPITSTTAITCPTMSNPEIAYSDPVLKQLFDKKQMPGIGYRLVSPSYDLTLLHKSYPALKPAVDRSLWPICKSDGTSISFSKAGELFQFTKAYSEFWVTAKGANVLATLYQIDKDGMLSPVGSITIKDGDSVWQFNLPGSVVGYSSASPDPKDPRYPAAYQLSFSKSSTYKGTPYSVPTKWNILKHRWEPDPEAIFTR